MFPPNPEGRPHIYTDVLADQICARLAEGAPLSKICQDKSMPCLATVYKWRREQPKFQLAYTQAREDQADTLADETVNIANTIKIGTKTTIRETSTGIETTTVEADMIEHRNLQVNSRKWFAARMSPKYSDKVVQEHSGPNGGPIKSEITKIRYEIVDPIRPKSDDTTSEEIPSAD